MKLLRLYCTVILLAHYTCFGQQAYDPSSKLDQLAMTMAILKHRYVKNLEDDQIAEKAIRGLLNQLDPHSDYLDMAELETLEDSTNGQVTGIGVELTTEDGLIKVVTPLDHSPAQEAGIRSGDFITHVDDVFIYDSSFYEVAKRIKGTPGTSVKITISRPKTNEVKHFMIERRVIKAPSVFAQIFDNQYLYLRVSYFGTPTANEIEQEVIKGRKNNKNLKGIIIDLRNNPGGVLDAAVQSTELFLDSKKLNYQGAVVRAKERGSSNELTWSARREDITQGTAIAVVVNSGSASGAEIMAGALQDHNRAVIIGEQTFGKGSIQSVLPISNTTAVKITTGLYYTPAGNTVQSQGITPDIISPELILLSTDKQLEIRESSYSNSITQGSEKRKSTIPMPNSDESFIQKYGFEVYQAVQYLQSQQQQEQCIS